MPLVVIVGTPCAGKSTFTNALYEHFERNAQIVSDTTFFERTASRNTVYKDGILEKQLRSSLKSAVQRHLGPKQLVIVDASNYIKGFRYELFCLAKEHQSTYCLVQLVVSREESLERNSKRPTDEMYEPEVIQALLNRYESPQDMNRWDSPLFNLNDKTDYTELFTNIGKVLFEKCAPPPNQSTQALPVSTTNLLHELERRTKSVIDHILESIRCGNYDVIPVPGLSVSVHLNGQPASMVQLNRIRRLFITFVKVHPVPVENIERSFIHFLNSNLCASI